jgi:hypothetical protein
LGRYHVVVVVVVVVMDSFPRKIDGEIGPRSNCTMTDD